MLGVDLVDVERVQVNEGLVVSSRDGAVIHLPFEEVTHWARPACLACGEYASDYADISVGSLGSPDGHATVLIRTEKGRRVYNGALGQGYIEERALGDAAQARAEKTTMLAKVVARAQRKQERAQARLGELGIEGG